MNETARDFRDRTGIRTTGDGGGRCRLSEEVPSPKKQRTTPQYEVEEEEEEEQASVSTVVGCSKTGDCGERSISFTLTDPDSLDCPICFDNLSTPVFQCRNGHLACSSCCVKLGNKCPSCSSWIGNDRCRAVEKILESIKIPCQNMKYGCREMVFYCKKHEHEDICIYGPCSCPLPDCDFIDCSGKLYLHFSTKHSKSAKSFRYDVHFSIALDVQQTFVILQEEKEGTIFILNSWPEYFGIVIYVSCIAPSTSKPGFCYDIEARSRGSSVKLLSFTEFVPAFVELGHCTLKRFLVVPRDFVGLDGRLKLELRIWGPSSSSWNSAYGGQSA